MTMPEAQNLTDFRRGPRRPWLGQARPGPTTVGEGERVFDVTPYEESVIQHLDPVDPGFTIYGADPSEFGGAGPTTVEHEQSESVEGREVGRNDGRWYNINGHTGEILTPVFPFERESYATMEEADAAAKRRSQLGEAPARPSPPPMNLPLSPRF
jgi:hypothetical protein